VLNVITSDLGQPFPGINEVPFSSELTFLDADVLIVNTSSLSGNWYHHATINASGKKYVSRGKGSNRILSLFQRRNNEVLSLLKSGKIVICNSSPVESVILETDSDDYPLTNYHWLSINPMISRIKSGIGKEIFLVNNNHAFASYYQAFKKDLQYQVYLNYSEKAEDVFLVNKTGHPVGWQINNGRGIIVFLPHPPKGVSQEKYFGVIIQCASNYFNVSAETPEPEWSKKYILPGVKQLEQDIKEIQKEIDKAIQNRDKIEFQKHELQKHRALLYEKGTPLEIAVINALRLLGFDAQNYKKDDKEHDIILNSSEGRAIAEVEGKDKDAIHIGKLDQLGRIIHEDFDEHDTLAQGILIGNAYRLIPLEKRTEPNFTEKVKIAIGRNGFSLLSTVELYNVIVKVLENPEDEQFKVYCRNKILKTRGEEIVFQKEKPSA